MSWGRFFIGVGGMILLYWLLFNVIGGKVFKDDKKR